LAFKFGQQNPKIMMRWPDFIKIGKQPRLNRKLSAYANMSVQRVYVIQRIRVSLR
jgi:hypothetical protein